MFRNDVETAKPPYRRRLGKAYADECCKSNEGMKAPRANVNPVNVQRIF